MKRTTLRNLLGSTALAGALAVGGLSIHGAFAQTPTTDPAPSATTAPAPATTQDPGTAPAFPADGPHGRRGRRGHGMDHGLVAATAQVTGLTEAQVQTDLAAGKSPAQVAEANGKTADDVVTAAVAALTTELDAKVAAGTLTQAEADARLATAPAHFKTEVMQTGLGGHGGGRMDLVRATADVTGLTVAAVQTDLAAGQSLAQIAAANGKTADAIIAALTTKAEADLATRLDAARAQLAVPGGR